MAEGEGQANKQREDRVNKKHPPLSLPLSPSPNSRKRKDPIHFAPSLNDCHSCGRHFPEGPQTLIILDSQWRIVLLCNLCLRSVRSAFKCSYCFSDFNDDGDRVVDCWQCRCRVHLSCVPSQQRFVSLAFLDPETFVCVDCCAVPRLGNRDPKSPFSRDSVEDLVRDASRKGKEAARAKAKAVEKVMAAKCAAERAKMALDAVSIVEIDRPVDDEELALRLHLAMNGSQRISRSGGQPDRSVQIKKGKGNSVGCSRSCDKIQLCTEDMGLLDSCGSSVELSSVERRKEPLKEIGCCSVSSPVDASVEVSSFERKEPREEVSCSSPAEDKKEEEGSCSNKIVICSGDNNSRPVFITYQRLRKLKGLGSRESTSDGKLEANLNCSCGEDGSSDWEQKSRCDPPNRYALKYSKRKSGCKQILDTESQLVPHYWQDSCSHASILSDTTISNL